MTDPKSLWRVGMTTSLAARDIVSALFEGNSAAVTVFETEENSGQWRVEGFADEEPDRAGLEQAISKICARVGESALSALRCELVPTRDWLSENMAQFPPTQVGRFFIHGSKFDNSLPPGCIPILLDPGTAFGSGLHASTAGCLSVIEDLSKAYRFTRPLDMGCGSGILAIAIAKTRRVPILAADIDDEAVRVTAFNAKRNGVGNLVSSICSPGYRTPKIARSGPYDLIVANILARPLIAMAGDLARHLKPRCDGGGVAVLSGLLERDGRRVMAAHQAHGLLLREWVVRDGWLTMVLHR